MGRFQPVRAVTSQYTSLSESLNSGLDVVDMLSKLDVLDPNAVAVQIGSGIGRVELHLHRRVQFCYGIDIAPTMVAHAQRNVRASNVRFVRASRLSDLPITQCDLIYSIFVFQHLPRPKVVEYLQESFALLSPGGALVFQILVDDRETKPEPPQAHPYALRYYRRPALQSLLGEIGYQDVKFQSFPNAGADSGADGDLVVVAVKPG